MCVVSNQTHVPWITDSFEKKSCRTNKTRQKKDLVIHICDDYPVIGRMNTTDVQYNRIKRAPNVISTDERG